MTRVGGCIMFLAFSVLTAYAYAQDKLAPSGDKVVEIKIENLQFVPGDISVTPGTKVRWINLDAVDHDVTSGDTITGRKARGLTKTKFPDGNFSSGLFGKNGTFSTTLDTPGEYPYYCNVHPFMTGVVNVVASDKP